jgi:hypothetical protein
MNYMEICTNLMNYMEICTNFMNYMEICTNFVYLIFSSSLRMIQDKSKHVGVVTNYL